MAKSKSRKSDSEEPKSIIPEILPPKKNGRPEIEIDWDQMEKLCQIHCTQAEICHFFQCTDDTLNNRVKKEYGITFSEYYQQKSSFGKISLRRVQLDRALKGDTFMMVWMGKQLLGQRDKPDFENVKQKPAEVHFIAKAIPPPPNHPGYYDQPIKMEEPIEEADGTEDNQGD